MSNTLKEKKGKKTPSNNWAKSRNKTKIVLNNININQYTPEEEEILYNENYHIKNTIYGEE